MSSAKALTPEGPPVHHWPQLGLASCDVPFLPPPGRTFFKPSSGRPRIQILPIPHPTTWPGCCWVPRHAKPQCSFVTALGPDQPPLPSGPRAQTTVAMGSLELDPANPDDDGGVQPQNLPPGGGEVSMAGPLASWAVGGEIVQHSLALGASGLTIDHISCD